MLILPEKMVRTTSFHSSTNAYPPPPIPAIARAAISISMEGVNPHRTVPEPGNVSGPCKCHFSETDWRDSEQGAMRLFGREYLTNDLYSKKWELITVKEFQCTPYSGVKQQSDRRYDVPMYDDWLTLLKEAPIGVKRVATIVPWQKALIHNF